MTYQNLIEITAAWASIFTAAVAVLFYVGYRCERREKRRRLENYLKDEKAKGEDKGQRTLPHLIANIGMSETDILDCAFRSRHIVRTVEVMDGKATGLFLEYRNVADS